MAFALWNLQLAATSLAVVPILIVYLVAQRQDVLKVSRFLGVKGRDMTSVTLTDIKKSFGAVDVIRGVDLEIENGEVRVVS